MLKIKSIKPTFTKVLTTTNRYEADNALDSNGVLLDNKKLEGSIKEYQTIVEVGPSVREFKVGDVVVIDPTRYLKRRFGENSLRNEIVDNPTIDINIPTITMEDKDYFLIDQNDILYTITDFEEVVEVKKHSLIMPKKNKLILN